MKQRGLLNIRPRLAPENMPYRKLVRDAPRPIRGRLKRPVLDPQHRRALGFQKKKPLGRWPGLPVNQ